jgi:acetate kinase
MRILVLNAGSSSLKFQLFDARSAQEMSVIAKGVVDRIGTPAVSVHVVVGELRSPDASAIRSMQDAAQTIFEQFTDPPVDAIGYRVVHGGDRFLEPARIDEAVVKDIEELTELAPLHNAVALDCIRAGQHLKPHTTAVAVFDTSFHRTMPEVARRYAIPLALADQHHLHRFGFHGISHRFVSRQLLKLIGRSTATGSRLITCHLGNGASACAIRDGKSIDTSMGLTPLEGLVMGTRSGDVDPGLVLHLVRVLKMSADQIDDLLNHRSGMLGLSGRSGDVRDLENVAAAGDSHAEMALECFAYRCRKYIGAYAAALGGIDGIAFAGGIGEHSPEIRGRIIRGLEFLGVKLDPHRNLSAKGQSSASIGGADVALWVIPTDEERQIAEEVFLLCSKGTQQ